MTSAPTPALTASLRVWPWVLTALLFVGTAAANQAIGSPGPVPVAVLLATAAMLPTVVPGFAHRWGVPAGALLLTSGAFTAVYFAAGYSDGPIFLALPAVTFVVAISTPVAGWIRWAVPALVLVALGLAGRWAWWERDAGHQHFWQAVGAVAIVAATGAIATAARSRMDAHTERVGRAATEERLRMAQDLHDGVGHGLAVIAMQAGVALHVLDRDPVAARESLEAIRATSKEALDALRSELATIAGEPAPRRPAAGLDAIPALIDRVRSAGLAVDVVGDPGDLPAASGAAAYGVVQEALTNVLRHAGASWAQVAWAQQPEFVVLSVTDDGRGGDVQDEGMGISGMRARVEGIGGGLHVGPHANGGFQVVADLPA
ncbi:sensor histidine kinase [Nocardioides sp. WS12]|uniref:sensor histidine kinase n=1 Tax=Nocardioides sp. WS12 TaxID=2486272 RepID=UPI0015FAEB2B|nr:sensor histidine kinase [Nocardioides sp. WS12]